MTHAGRRVERRAASTSRLRRVLRRRGADAAPEHDVEPAHDARSGRPAAADALDRAAHASSRRRAARSAAAAEASLQPARGASCVPSGMTRAATGGPAVPAAESGRDAGQRPRGRRRRRRPAINPLLLQDPNKAYTDAVVQALIDAMVDYALPMVSFLPPEAVSDRGRARQRAPRSAGAAEPVRSRSRPSRCASRAATWPPTGPARSTGTRRRKRVEVQEF